MDQHTSTLLRPLGAIFALALLASPVLAAPTSAELSRATPENTRAACTDHLDNDLDGHEDCDDQDCQELVICSSKAKPAASLAPVPSSPDHYLKRRRATMRIVAGSIMMAFGVVLPAISGATWWLRSGMSSYDDAKPVMTGVSVILDLGGVGLIAAGATYLTLGAGDAAALKYANVAGVGVSF